MANWTGKKVALTGATGFVGYHVARQLHALGADVLALVRGTSNVQPLLGAGIPWPVVVALMLLAGGAIGIVQGYFVAFEGIPPFIVTLAGLSMIRGLALLLTKGYSIPIDPERH